MDWIQILAGVAIAALIIRGMNPARQAFKASKERMLLEADMIRRGLHPGWGGGWYKCPTCNEDIKYIDGYREYRVTDGELLASCHEVGTVLSGNRGVVNIFYVHDDCSDPDPCRCLRAGFPYLINLGEY